MRTTISDEVERLVSGLVGRSFGSIAIVAAVGWLDEGVDGDVLVRVSLTLSDPIGETWPDEDLFELRRAFRSEAEALNLPISFDFRPSTTEDLADDEGEVGDDAP